jgi:Secretion system C-terminal sorting domain
MKKQLSFKLLLVLLIALSQKSFANSVVFNQSFVSGSTPSAAVCGAWTTFRAALLSTYSYTSFTISGSLDVTGITCTDPVVTAAVANALRTGTTYSGTASGHTWVVGVGCGSGCSATSVELLADGSTCSCLTSGYDLRPDIGNYNWGGIVGATCLAGSQTMIVTFNYGPSAPGIVGTSTYCVGSPITLTATTTATTPTFIWSGPSGFSYTGASIVVPTSTAGTQVYSVTVTNPSGISSPTLDTIHIVAVPDITVGANPVVCAGSSFGALAYTSAVGSPLTYTIVYTPAAITAGFTDVTGATLPVSPITIFAPTGVSPGTYSGTISVANATCSGLSHPFNVIVSPSPAPITGATDFCPGATLSLHDVTPGDKWSSTDNTVASVDSVTGLVTGVGGGVAFISYTDPTTGCAADVAVNVATVTGPPNVCALDSIVLTATSTMGNWTSGNTSIATVDAPGYVTGVGMGIAPISYNLPAAHCSVVFNVSVNALAPILGRDSVCIGGTRYLTDIVGGGTWSAVFPLIASITPDSGKVTGRAVGITQMSYLLPSGCLATVNFQVVSFPGSISGTTQACPGSNTTLHNSTSGGVWGSLNTGIATINPTTGVITGVAADTVDITYTINPGCAVTTRVTINPLPEPITGTGIMCPATTDTLRDATPGGVWTSATSSVASVDTGIVTALTGGVAVISYTLPTSCAQIKVISVDPIPVPVVTFDGLTGTLYTPNIYTSYQWYDSVSGVIPGATAPSIAALYPEYYYVVVTDSNGCKGASALYHYPPYNVGVNSVTANGNIRIYPNPTTGVLYIESPVNVRAEVRGIDGRKEMDVHNAKEINISRLADGIYFITLSDDHGNTVSIQKVTKQ